MYNYGIESTNMNIYINSTKGKDEAISGLVTLGDFVYVSGQYGQGDTIDEQTRSACSQIQKQLDLMKLKMHHVLKTTIYVTDFSLKDRVLKIYQSYFEAPYPASTVIQVDGLGQGVHVCIEAQAIDTTRFERQESKSCDDCQEC